MAAFKLVPIDEPEESGPSSATVFGISAIRRLADNVLALPQTVSGLLSSSLPETTVPRGLGLLHSPFTAGGEQTPAEFPIPAPTTGDIAAGIRAAPQLLTDPQAFSREQERQARADVAFAQSSPMASSAGELTGDIAGLIALRKPAARGIRSAEESLTSTQVTLPLSPGGRFVAESVLNSPKVRSLARGAGRSVETGIDASVLSVLQGEDPSEIAGYAAGSQLAGSAILGGTKSLFTGGVLRAGAKLTIAAGATMGIIQVMKSATPGGRDRILESIETGFDKVKWGLLLGTLSGVAGAGRIRGGDLSKHFPKVTDAVSTMPRATIIALANEWKSSKEEDQQKMERVLQLHSQDPGFFGSASKKINRALEDSKVSLVDTINQLSEDKEFRQKLEAEERKFRLVPLDER